MIINHNIAAMNTHRQMTGNTSNVNKSLEKLSSGLRINKSGDDAAGLSISEKMRGQIRGLNQASRNTQDGISLIQTAEGGLNEIHSLVQRGRELSVQAANDGTLTADDKQSLQNEVNQIKKEVDRIATNTEFNGMKILNQSSMGGAAKKAMLDALPGMLENAEKLISTYYGLQGDGANLSIFLDDSIDGAGGTLAYVSAGIDSVTHKGLNIQLHVDMSDFPTFTAPNGNTDPFNYLDRTIAHEMVHAVVDRTMNLDPNAEGPGQGGVPTWFNEGLAEYIKGGADRVWATLGAGGTAAGMVSRLGGGYGWDTSNSITANESYSAGYAAVRYLEQDLVANGSSLSAFLDRMETGLSFDDALQATFTATESSYANIGAFMADFQSAGGGQAFIATVAAGFGGAGGDVGAIGRSSDADTSVADNLTRTAADPMINWAELFPALTNSAGINVHVGANTDQYLKVNLSNVDANSIGIANVDLTVDANDAIDKFDNAIQTVSQVRSRFGALQNRLEHAMAVTNINAENTQASESRIRDVDMAKEMMGFTKFNILNQSAQAMLVQANQQPQGVLQLLR